MTSSGIKRGVATAAISALAVAGLPLFAGSANADAYADQIGSADTRLYSLYSGNGSIQNDGTNSTVHLLAGGGSDVSQVRFEYLSGADWVEIATVSRSNGGFSTEWAPPTSVYNTDVEVRAQALGSVGTPIGDADTKTARIGGGQPAVDIANAPGSAIPTFDQPYSEAGHTGRLGVITGETSDVSDGASVMVSDLTNGASAGNQAVLEPAANGTRAFTGIVDFGGYDFDTEAPVVNEAVVGAESGSDDAELVTLTEQVISSVKAEVGPNPVQAGKTATAVVTVKDQNGTPIAGVQVFQEGVDAFTYTDAHGTAEFPGLAGSAAGEDYAFVVNTTDGDAYEPAVDYRRTVTVTSYEGAATTITAASKDGAAFDTDEFAAGDIFVTVNDQNGNGLAGKKVNAQWTVTGFDAGSKPETTNATVTDNGDGTYAVSAPAAGTAELNAWIEVDGTPGQSAGDMSIEPLSVKSGDANPVWADGNVAQARSGSTHTFEGTLELPDGTPLANRKVTMDWTSAGNPVMAAQGAQPAGTTRDTNTSAHATTGEDGGFAVAISDPANPTGTSQYDAGDLAAHALGGNDSMDVEFLEHTAVDVASTDTHQQALAGQASPGRPVEVGIKVRNQDGDLLTDLPVTVSTDHGFFTTSKAESLDELVPDPAAAEGADFGEWEDLGTEVETTTNDNGYAEAVVAIERDPGFDDDGRVKTTVTFEVGGESITQDVEFSSDNPLNPGELTITLADDQTIEDGTFPNAPIGEQIAWDVKATDQFGNRTEVEVDLDDNGSDAEHDQNRSSNFEGDEAAWSWSHEEADQILTGTWQAETTTWTDADPAQDGFQAERKAGTAKVTADSMEVNWYEIDYAASSYSMSHSGGEQLKVGSTTVMTYKAIDQHGEPISGLHVEFFRSGPDSTHVGAQDGEGFTGQKGVAQYVFQGETAGDATVTGLAYRLDGIDGPQARSLDVDLEDFVTLIPESEATDVVTFGTQAQPIDVKVGGKHNGAKADRMKVKAPAAAAGAKVKLFKVKKNGKKVRVASGVLNARGNKVFKVKDRNGKKVTKYVAKVGKTAATKADWTRIKRIR